MFAAIDNYIKVRSLPKGMQESYLKSKDVSIETHLPFFSMAIPGLYCMQYEPPKFSARSTSVHSFSNKRDLDFEVKIQSLMNIIKTVKHAATISNFLWSNRGFFISRMVSARTCDRLTSILVRGTSSHSWSDCGFGRLAFCRSRLIQSPKLPGSTSLQVQWIVSQNSLY